MTDTILTRDQPGLWWALALLFVSVGSAFLFIGLMRSAGLPPWQGPLAAAMGLASVAVGGWVGWNAPISIVAIDLGRGELLLTQLGLFGRRVHRVPFSEIVDVIAEHKPDDEGDPMARPALVLRSGDSFPLSSLWRHDPVGIARVAASIKAAIPGQGIADR